MGLSCTLFSVPTEVRYLRSCMDLPPGILFCNYITYMEALWPCNHDDLLYYVLSMLLFLFRISKKD